MIGAIVFLLLGAGGLYLAYYLGGVLTFEGAADRILFWGAAALGAILVLCGIICLVRWLGEHRAVAKKAPQKTPQKPRASFSEGGGTDALGTAIFLFIAEALLMLLACLVVHWFFEEKVERFSTVLIILAAISYFAVFLGLAELNYDHEFFKKCKVYGRTPKEVQADVAKILADTGYAVYVRRVAVSMAPVFLVQAAIATLIDPLCINFLVATPVALFVSLIHLLAGPKKTAEVANDLIAHREGNDWKNYRCPKCGVILGKSHTADDTVKTGETKTLGSETYTVTDKYTNGYDTIYVDRKEKDYYVHTQSSYLHFYSCPRCKHRWKKSEVTGEREYL